MSPDGPRPHVQRTPTKWTLKMPTYVERLPDVHAYSWPFKWTVPNPTGDFNAFSPSCG